MSQKHGSHYVKFMSGLYEGATLSVDYNKSEYKFSRDSSPYRWWAYSAALNSSDVPPEVMKLVRLWENSQYADLNLSEFIRPLLEDSDS